jgi:hypothetical protein
MQVAKIFRSSYERHAASHMHSVLIPARALLLNCVLMLIYILMLTHALMLTRVPMLTRVRFCVIENPIVVTLKPTPLIVLSSFRHIKITPWLCLLLSTRPAHEIHAK